MELNDPSTSGSWRFAQCFGDKGEVDDITEGVLLPNRPQFAPIKSSVRTADIISTVEFDHTGDYLATGDKGGRVVLFERNDSVRGQWPPGLVADTVTLQKKGCEYKFYTEFQSHEPEFDYLKSLEIEEKINKIKWCKRQNAAHFLLSTNGTLQSGPTRQDLPSSTDKTIKLWKVHEKALKVVAESNLHDGQRPIPPPTQHANLRLPRVVPQDNIVAAVPRKVYSNAHAYHINSISINSDGETYISADDLRVNLWNLNISDQSFSASSACFTCVQRH